VTSHTLTAVPRRIPPARGHLGLKGTRSREEIYEHRRAVDDDPIPQLWQRRQLLESLLAQNDLRARDQLSDGIPVLLQQIPPSRISHRPLLQTFHRSPSHRIHHSQGVLATGLPSVCLWSASQPMRRNCIRAKASGLM
jgi:hypothetical protein